MMRTDITFADVTGLTYIPQNKNIAFPDQPRLQNIVRPLFDKISETELQGFMTGLTGNPHRASRRAGSEISIDWSVKLLNSIISALPAERQRLFKVETVEIRGYVAKSIIVTMAGNSTDITIVGAHIDDVGHPNAGADDDASGTIVVFEAFRVIAESNWKPSRTLEFMFYTAEEAGLIGSRQIAQSYRTQNKKVYASLQHDMVGYQKPGEPLQVYMVIPQTNALLNTFVRKLWATYSGTPVVDYRSSYGSDHASWNAIGAPAACVKEFYWSPQYHQASDKPVHINFKLLVEFTKVAVAFAIELSQ